MLLYHSNVCWNLPLAIDGGWSEWVAEGSCSTTCGNGKQKYVRKCNNPTPEAGGKECEGKDTKEETCQLIGCPGNVILVICYSLSVCPLCKNRKIMVL